uniref:Uncharacterized protein TCIL3000_11_10890 n=1 Tax=Trypanosoma congolense (strain IL3000) TaxID=1068625 RepID=G0V1U1_TRYCI|nr:unnamed protein product [Trypanosoma congolense IL3000]
MSGKRLLATQPLLGPVAGRSLSAPRSMPTFKPVPFKREKFLSIKTRTADAFFGTRRRMLERSAAITEQLSAKKSNQNPLSAVPARSSNENSRNSVEDSGTPSRSEVLMFGPPLTSQQADEINAWNRNLLGLEGMQGFVLMDELVYEAVLRNIRIGAYPHALNWLEKAASEGRVPIPTTVMQGLCVFINSVLSVLPASNASFAVANGVLLQTVSTLETTLGTSGDPLKEVKKDNVTCDEPVGENAPLRIFGTSPFARHIFRELYIPVWKCLQQLGLFTSMGRITEDVFDKGHRDLLGMEVIRLLKIIQHNDSASCDGGCTNFDPEKALPARRAFADLLLALAQCAAEAKEVNFLLHLQSVFCVLFAEPCRQIDSNPSDCGATLYGWRLRRKLWCGEGGEEEWLCRFANDFLSTVFYGRLAHRSELMLVKCIRVMDSAALVDVGAEENGKFVENESRSDDRSTCGDSQGPEQPVPSTSAPERGVDQVLWEMLKNETSLLNDAITYAGLLFYGEGGSLFSCNFSDTSRFSQAELEWLKVHSVMLRRCERGENVVKELCDLILPGAAVARCLERCGDCVEDQQCLLGLVVETVLSVAAASLEAVLERGSFILKSVRQLLLRVEEVGTVGSQRLLLPPYSVGCVMVSLCPLLLFGKVDSTKHLEEQEGLNEECGPVFSRLEAVRLLKDLMPSVVEQSVTFGDVYSGILVALSVAEMWEEVMQLLTHLDKAHEADATDRQCHGICSALVDQRVWAWLFRRARDAGEVNICLFLRSRREQLFY